MSDVHIHVLYASYLPFMLVLFQITLYTTLFLTWLEETGTSGHVTGARLIDSHMAVMRWNIGLSKLQNNMEVGIVVGSGPF